jgi:hypothetical protein
MNKVKDTSKPNATVDRATKTKAAYQGKGEGDHESAKRFNDAETAFVKSGKVQKAAGKAAPESPKIARELAQAEQVGRARAKEEDPQVSARANKVPTNETSNKVALKKPSSNGHSGFTNQSVHNGLNDDDDLDSDFASTESGKGPMDGNNTTAHSTEVAHEIAQTEKAKHAGSARAKASPPVSGGTGRSKTK